MRSGADDCFCCGGSCRSLASNGGSDNISHRTYAARGKGPAPLPRPHFLARNPIEVELLGAVGLLFPESLVARDVAVGFRPTATRHRHHAVLDVEARPRISAAGRHIAIRIIAESGDPVRRRVDTERRAGRRALSHHRRRPVPESVIAEALAPRRIGGRGRDQPLQPVVRIRDFFAGDPVLLLLGTIRPLLGRFDNDIPYRVFNQLGPYLYGTVSYRLGVPSQSAYEFRAGPQLSPRFLAQEFG
jgi:hypothetical protein